MPNINQIQMNWPNKVGHLLSELGSDLKTSDTLLITLLSKIGQCKFDTAIPTVDDQPYYPS